MTKGWIKQKKTNALEQPSQSPDFNPIEVLGKDYNIPELKLFGQEEKAKISPSGYAGLISCYR